jgi:hypothetical protein
VDRLKWLLLPLLLLSLLPPLHAQTDGVSKYRAEEIADHYRRSGEVAYAWGPLSHHGEKVWVVLYISQGQKTGILPIDAVTGEIIQDPEAAEEIFSAFEGGRKWTFAEMERELEDLQEIRRMVFRLQELSDRIRSENGRSEGERPLRLMAIGIANSSSSIAEGITELIWKREGILRLEAEFLRTRGSTLVEGVALQEERLVPLRTELLGEIDLLMRRLTGFQEMGASPPLNGEGKDLLPELSSFRWELQMRTLGWEQRKSNARREVLWDLEALQARTKREPRLSLNLTSSPSAHPGEVIWAKVLLQNEGDGKAEGIRLFFEAPLILEPLTPPEIRIEELLPGQSREFEVGFRVQSGAPPAAYSLTVRGTYQDPLGRKVDMRAVSSSLIVREEEVSLREEILQRIFQILF